MCAFVGSCSYPRFSAIEKFAVSVVCFQIYEIGGTLTNIVVKKLRSTDIVYSSSLFFLYRYLQLFFTSPLMSAMMLLTKKMIQFNDNDDESGVYIFSENCS